MDLSVVPRRRPSSGQGRFLEERFAAVEAAGDLEGLPLRAGRRRVCGEVARGGEQRQGGVVGVGVHVLADGRLDALDRVEVAVLAHQARAERGDEPGRVAAGAEVRRDELRGLVDLLLARRAGAAAPPEA